MSQEARVSLFVSHSGTDAQRAMWVVEQLRAAGYDVEFDRSDWATGDDFLQRMGQALARCRTMVALWSPDYFRDGSYSLRELKAAEFAGLAVIPLRLLDFRPPPLWAHLIYRDLFNLDEEQAQRVLLDAVAGRPEPSDGVWTDQAAAPAIWNVPARSPLFSGRDKLLDDLRASLAAGSRVAVYALHGAGGVGKTQLAIEYIHRHASDYTLVWWINAEQPELIGEQFAALAVQARAVEPGTDTPTGMAAAQELLRRGQRWMVVLDNAPSREHVVGWVPQGRGHVIITSRSAAWIGVASGLAVDVFTRAESISLLREQVPDINDSDADRLAQELGDLPLALTQAVSLIRDEAMGVDEYLVQLRSATTQVLARGVHIGYPASLAATVALALRRVDHIGPAAGELVRLCAWLGPEPIPCWLLTGGAATLPPALAAVATNALQLHETLGQLARTGLVQLGVQSLSMHRLTQAVIRADHIEGDAGGRRHVEALLAAAQPENTEDPVWWPRWAQLLPHILATDPATTGNSAMMTLARKALWNLRARGDYTTALALTEPLHQQWRERHGDDHLEVLAAANVLATLYRRGQADLARARVLDEETLARRRRLLGPDDVASLTSANNLARDLYALGDIAAARELDEDTLARRRQVLGDDHPVTRISVSNLAADLRMLGEVEAARQLDEDILSRRRRALGDDHPATLVSANNLANDLRLLGDVEAARRLDEDTLARRRRILGDDHPGTLLSATNLALDLRQLGEFEAARQLHEETLARRRRVLGDEHPNTLASATNLALDLQALSDLETGRQLDEEH